MFAPKKNPVDFFLFVTFFPQLVAGPIERAGHLLAQIKQPRHARAEDFRWGIQTTLRGMVKKVVVADNLAPVVNQLFGEASLSGPPGDRREPRLCVSDLLRFLGLYRHRTGGVARCMGFRLALNFRRPYLATSPTEFWRRWHITLSTWFRDYVFVPLGGSRRSPGRIALNLMTTFVLSGLWHGASLNFVLWGVFHGAALVLHKCWASWGAVAGLRSERIYPVFAWAANFALVLYGWLLFRVTESSAIWRYTVALFSDFDQLALAMLIGTRILPFIGLAVFVDWLESWGERETHFELGRFAWLPQPATVALLLAITIFGAEGGGDFIYFKF